MSDVYIIAGPNGSGKSTFAQEFLAKYTDCRNFVNADLIALGLSPLDPVKVRLKAGRLLLEQINDFIAEKETFAFESTLAGKTYLELLARAKKEGYRVHIYFLWIPDVRLAKARIQQRVKNGGHDVPVEDIERRFIRSQRNFIEDYRKMATTWIVFDNSLEKPKEIMSFDSKRITIKNKKLYNAFEGNHHSTTKK